MYSVRQGLSQRPWDLLCQIWLFLLWLRCQRGWQLPGETEYLRSSWEENDSGNFGLQVIHPLTFIPSFHLVRVIASPHVQLKRLAFLVKVMWWIYQVHVTTTQAIKCILSLVLVKMLYFSHYYCFSSVFVSIFIYYIANLQYRALQVLNDYCKWDIQLVTTASFSRKVKAVYIKLKR